MRAAPPFHITLEHFGQWRAAVSLLVAMACSSALGWAWVAFAGTPVAAMLGAIAVTGLGAAAALAWVWRLRPTSLRWDGQSWHWGGETARGSEASSGSLTVACDLGSWLLVRLDEVPMSAPWYLPRRRWLPIQRSGHEGPWHALRCTVYSPRPSPSTLPSLRPDPLPE